MVGTIQQEMLLLEAGQLANVVMCVISQVIWQKIVKPTREQESRGSTTHKEPNKSSTRQITSESNETYDTDEEDSLDPLSLLYSDSEGTVDTVRVSDKGSRPQYVNVEIQGVPTSGVIDTGADITIIGGGLFKKIATAARLRKKDFEKPDRIPRTYDRKPSELHGKMYLEISFDGKSLRTPIYIKMDTHDQLLLAEGVCSQLGIIKYHKDVWPGRKIVMEAAQAQELESKDASILSVK